MGKESQLTGTRSTRSNSLDTGKNGLATLPGRYGVMRERSKSVSLLETESEASSHSLNMLLKLAAERSIDLPDTKLLYRDSKIVENLLSLLDKFSDRNSYWAVTIYCQLNFDPLIFQFLNELANIKDNRLEDILLFIQKKGKKLNKKNLLELLSTSFMSDSFYKDFYLCQDNDFDDGTVGFVKKVNKLDAEKKDFAFEKFNDLKSESKISKGLFDFLSELNITRINSLFDFASDQNFSAQFLKYAKLIQEGSFDVSQEGLALKYYTSVGDRNDNTISEVFLLIENYSNTQSRQLIDIYKKNDFDIEKVKGVLKQLSDKGRGKAELEKNKSLSDIDFNTQESIKNIDALASNELKRKSIFKDLTNKQKKSTIVFDSWVAGKESVLSAGKKLQEEFSAILERALEEERNVVMHVANTDKNSIEANYSDASEIQEFIDFFYRVDGYIDIIDVLDKVDDDFVKAEKLIQILQSCNDDFKNELLKGLSDKSIDSLAQPAIGVVNAITILSSFSVEEIDKAFQSSQNFPLLAIANAIAPLNLSVTQKKNLLGLSISEINRIIALPQVQINTLLVNTSYQVLQHYCKTDDTLNLLLLLKAAPAPVANSKILAWATKLDKISKYLPTNSVALVNLIRNRDLADLEACADFLPDNNFPNLNLLLTRIAAGCYVQVFDFCKLAKPAVDASDLLGLLTTLPNNQDYITVKNQICNHILYRYDKELHLKRYLIDVNFLKAQGYCTLVVTQSWHALNPDEENGTQEKNIDVQVGGTMKRTFVAHAHPGASGSGVGHANASQKHFKASRGNLLSQRVLVHDLPDVPLLKYLLDDAPH